MEVIVRSTLQTLSVCINVFVFLLGPLASVWLIWFVFYYTPIWWLVPLYFTWYISDIESPKHGAHLSLRFRRMLFFKYIVSYFPISLLKTAELNPSKNYIIVNHPHGIMSAGAFGNFSTDATGFSEMFPGIRTYLSTLDMNFLWPFRREYLLLAGAVSCSKESIGYLISRPEGGNAVVIVVGGAEEALESQPETHRIILRERKGFIKVAMKYGTALVPSYSFGEVDIFCQVSNGKGSKLRTVQNAIGKALTFTIPLFYGRGIFGFRFGLLPFRRPICTVVGRPIEVDRNEIPTEEELNRVHERYLSELVDLFESHKRSFGIPESASLEVL